MIQQKLNDLFADSFKENWDLPALTDYATKETLTYAQLATEVAKLHLLFRQMGVKPGDKIALVGKDCVRWAISFVSVVTYGGVIVPILKEFHPKDITRLIVHSESVALFVTDSVWNALRQNELTDLRAVFSLLDFRTIWQHEGENCKEYTENMSSLFEHEYPDGFKASDIKYADRDNSELAEINYTSGTTGNSKGVMLSANSLAGNITFGFETYLTGRNIRILSFLPMAHAYGCAFDLLVQITTGAHVTFLNRTPSPRIIMEAFKDVRPNVIFTVPLVVEKIYQKKILPQISTNKYKFLSAIPLVGFLLKMVIRHFLMKAFGGRCIEMVIGGASFNPEAEKFLRGIHFPFTVGYGMTECGPLISYAPWRQYRPGSVGKVLPKMQVRIDSKDPYHVMGEIQVKGENVMMGYYKNEDATHAALDADGWLHTGDSGVVDKDDFIYIKGRVKTMLLGPSGQNIYPEEIEAKLINMKLVSDCLVVSRNNQVVALVHPDYKMAEDNRMGTADIVKQMDLNRQLLNKQLPAFEQVAKIIIQREEFEKTPKKSIKRFLYESVN